MSTANPFDLYLQETVQDFTPQERKAYEQGKLSVSIPPDLSPTPSSAPDRLRTAKIFDLFDAESLLSSVACELSKNADALLSVEDIARAVEKTVCEALAFCSQGLNDPR